MDYPWNAKTIVCHFANGPEDGELRSDSANETERSGAIGYFSLTKNGKIGCACKMVPTSQRESGQFMSAHRYDVVERTESDTEIHVHYTHTPDK